MCRLPSLLLDLKALLQACDGSSCVAKWFGTLVHVDTGILGSVFSGYHLSAQSSEATQHLPRVKIKLKARNGSNFCRSMGGGVAASRLHLCPSQPLALQSTSLLLCGFGSPLCYQWQRITAENHCMENGGEKWKEWPQPFLVCPLGAPLMSYWGRSGQKHHQ